MIRRETQQQPPTLLPATSLTRGDATRGRARFTPAAASCTKTHTCGHGHTTRCQARGRHDLHEYDCRRTHT